MKTVWIFNHYATKPDEPATRSYDFARELAGLGHKITIFASSFSHYQLKEKYLFKNEKWSEETLNGVRFIWIKTFPYKKNNWRRALNMLSYGIRAYNISKTIKEKPDIIIGTSVHPLAALSAYFVSRKKGGRFFFEISDIWPGTLVDMGFMSRFNPLVVILGVIERFLYKKAEKIIIFLPRMAEHITNFGVSKTKIFYVPNGVDISRCEGLRQYDGGSHKSLLFIYSGIHSPYVGLDNLLKAAEILEKRGEEGFKILLIGNGSEKPRLMRLAKKMNLKSVEFMDMVSKEDIYKILSKADVFISIITDIIIKYGVSSNKLNDYLAVGRPIIFSARSKNNPVEEARAGITVPPENSKAIADAIFKMVSLKREERIKLAENGKRYARENLDIKILARKLEKLF